MSDVYPEGHAGVARSWEIDGGAVCTVLRTKTGHLCGYARFKSRPVKEPGYGGIVSYVPVHGGVTYAEEDADGSMVYGFDCAHSGDYSEWDPSGRVWSEDEVAGQVEQMVRGILAAVAFEDRYLLAGDGQARGAVLDEYHAALGVPFDVTDNFGAMIGVLGGLDRP